MVPRLTWPTTRLSCSGVVALALVWSLAWRCRSADAITRVFEAGEGGYSCYRIPSLVTTSSGALLAFVEGRRDSCADWAEIDIILRRSADGGASWSDMSTVVHGCSGEHISAGNFAPVQERSSGRVLLPFTFGNAELWLTHSDDDGLTWAERVPLPGFRVPSWSWVGFGPPGATQLASGRLVVPLHASAMPFFEAGALGFSAVVYSDDLGATWQGPGQVPNGFAGLLTGILGNENQVAELPSGGLLMNSRTLGGKRLISKSVDGGETWSPFVKVEIPQPINGCQGSLISIDDPPRLLFSGVNGGRRANLTLWIGDSSGENWHASYTIDPGDAGYSTLAQLRGGVALLWERASSTEIVFTQLPPEAYGGRASRRLGGQAPTVIGSARRMAPTCPDPRATLAMRALLVCCWVLLLGAWAGLCGSPHFLGRELAPGRRGLALRALLVALLVWDTILVVLATIFAGRDDATRSRRNFLIAIICCLTAIVIEVALVALPQCGAKPLSSSPLLGTCSAESSETSEND